MHLLHIYVLYISSFSSNLSEVEKNIYLTYLLFWCPPEAENK